MCCSLLFLFFFFFMKFIYYFLKWDKASEKEEKKFPCPADAKRPSTEYRQGKRDRRKQAVLKTFMFRCILRELIIRSNKITWQDWRRGRAKKVNLWIKAFYFLWISDIDAFQHQKHFGDAVLWDKIKRIWLWVFSAKDYCCIIMQKNSGTLILDGSLQMTKQ